MIGALLAVGLLVAVGTLAAIVWSIYLPEQRIWPPNHYTKRTPFLVWTPTFVLFGAIVAVGILQWGQWTWPVWLRFGVGVPLIALGNLCVWFEVAKFGVAKTGGAGGSLRTSGLYRYSRNPQYVADCLMLTGWILLSASSGATLLAVAGIVVLLAAPFAEEPWLIERYGQQYRDYQKAVRRYL